MGVNTHTEWDLARQMRYTTKFGTPVLEGFTPMHNGSRDEVARATSETRHGFRHALGSCMLVDPQGRAWRVYETYTTHVPGARGPQCLIFDTPGHCFRVWHYPIDWRELKPAELLALGGITPDD